MEKGKDKAIDIAMSSKVITVIEAKLLDFGSETEDDPGRIITQYLDLNGNLLAENVTPMKPKKETDHEAKQPTTYQPEEVRVHVLTTEGNELLLTVGNSSILISDYMIKNIGNGLVEMNIKIVGKSSLTELFAFI